MIVNGNSKYVSYMKNMWKSIFGDAERYIDLFFNNVYKDDETLLWVEDDNVLAMMFFPQYDIKVYEKFYTVGYICGVAAKHEVRGTGIMRELLNESFKAMKRRGDVASVLIPSNERLFDYYKKYGYKPFFKLGIKEYVRGSRNLKDLGISLRETLSATEILSLYSENISKYNVIVLQTLATYETVITNQINEGGKVYIIESADGEKLGYIFCYHDKESGALVVNEAIVKGDILNSIAGLLLDIHNVDKVIFECINDKKFNLKKLRNFGMVKAHSKEFNIPNLSLEISYMNMMLN